MNGHVHYGLTKRWAIEAGFSTADAEVIARADIDVDRAFPGRAWRNKRYHFAWLGARRISREWLAQAVGDADLVLLGRALHCAQDAVSHGRLGHFVHWPGIDLWERRRPGVQRRIERVSREMLDAYASEHPPAALDADWTGEDIL